MKWLVFSDSHGRWEYMKRAVEKEQPDRVLHLGDVTRDAQRLLAECPGLQLEQVRGNCDGFIDDYPEEKEIFFGTKRVWLLHGHTYRVKMGIGMLTSEARARGVNVVLFGHTHEPLCFLEGNLWVMNPGAIGGPAAQPTYGVIEERSGELYCRLETLPKR